MAKNDELHAALEEALSPPKSRTAEVRAKLFAVIDPVLSVQRTVFGIWSFGPPSTPATAWTHCGALVHDFKHEPLAKPPSPVAVQAQTMMSLFGAVQGVSTEGERQQSRDGWTFEVRLERTGDRTLVHEFSNPRPPRDDLVRLETALRATAQDLEPTLLARLGRLIR